MHSSSGTMSDRVAISAGVRGNEILVCCNVPTMVNVRVPMARDGRRRGWVAVFLPEDTQNQQPMSTVTIGMHNNEPNVVSKGCVSAFHRIVFASPGTQPNWCVDEIEHAAIVISLESCARAILQEEQLFWRRRPCILTQGTPSTPHFQGMNGMTNGAVNVFGEVDVVIRPAKDKHTLETNGYPAKILVDNLSPDLSPGEVYRFPINITLPSGETRSLIIGANLTMFAIAGIKNREDIEKLIKVDMLEEESCIQDPASLVRNSFGNT